MRTGRFYGWWMAAATFIIILLAFASYYSLPVSYPALMREFGCTRSQVAMGAAIALLVTGFASPSAGALADRRGPRFTIRAGVVLTAISMAGMSQIRTMRQFYAMAVVFGLGMAGYSIVIVQTLMARWFVRRRGLATGLVISGMGFGGTIGPLVVAPLLISHGWRSAFVCDAVALIAIALPAALWVVRDDPERAELSSDSGAAFACAPKKDAAGMPFSQAVRSMNFWALSAGTFCAIFAAISVIQHLILYMRELHLELITASRTLSLLLLASVVGRIVIGWISDYLTSRRALILSYVLLTIGTALLLFPLGARGFLAMAVLVGLGYGGSLVMLTLCAAEAFGLHSLGRILGTIIIFLTLGGAIGPVAVGLAADKMGGYHAAFGSIVLAACASVVAGCHVRANGPGTASKADTATA